MTGSLRTRLVISVVSGMVLLLAVFSLILYVVIRRALVNQFDASLLSTARMLAASVEQDGSEIELEFEVRQLPEFNDPQRPTYYQIWRPDGAVVAKSPLLGADGLLRLEGSLDPPVFGALRAGNGQPQRTVGFKFIPRLSDSDRVTDPQLTKEQTLTLVVVRDASDLHHQLHLLQWLLLITSGATIALSVFVAAIVVRRGLEPLNSIANEIAAIKEDNLAARIKTTSVPAEIIPIKSRLNDLLSRLEDAFKRERRFTADVAHELRTPLAGIRSTIEVTLTRARDQDEYKRVLCDCQAIAENMQTMVNNLLMLARLDAQQITFHCEQIRLAEMVNSCWRSLCDKALVRENVFENRIPVEITCDSDPEHLSMVFINLLDNAVEYTNNGGQIWATGRQTDDSIEITVANTGCTLTSEQAAQVFDCFWRGDSSRTGTGTHCGLGLALVQRLVRALGGYTIVDVQNSGIFTILLALPARGESGNLFRPAVGTN